MDEVNARVRRLEDELTQVVAENRLMRNRLIELGELRIFGDISAPTRAPATASPFNFSVPVSPMHYTPPHSAQSSRSVPANMGSASSGRGDYITVPGRNTSAFPALAHCSPSNHARFCAGDEDELRSPFSQSGGSGSGLVVRCTLQRTPRSANRCSLPLNRRTLLPHLNPTPLRPRST